MNTTLIEFEHHVRLPAKHACRLLGVAYVTYIHYRNGSRELPQYHVRHILVIYMLNEAQLQQLIQEVTQ